MVAINQSSFISFEKAVDSLKKGKAILYPTETYYALGCDAFNAEAISLIYKVKNRSVKKPLPLIIPSLDFLSKLVAYVDPLSEQIIKLFWPAPITIILPASKKLPEIATGGTGFVAVRMSPHPIPIKLGLESDTVLTASSANISGRKPAVEAKALDPELVKQSAGILDLGPEPGGLKASTIIKALPDSRKIEIRREGAIGKDVLIRAGFKIA